MAELRHAPPHAVDRPRLLRKLDSSLRLPLALVIAQAGSGKTMLLSQWAALHPDENVVWLDVVPSDNDPVRFLRRYLAAVSVPDQDDTALTGLVAMGDGGLGEPVLTALQDVLAGLPETVTIFDDLHNLSNPRLIADLGALVESLPSTQHFVFSSRVDPPIGSSRHRLRLDMVEIRQIDLALTDQESGTLLERLVGRPLDPADVSALVSRTEGWAAGIQLAGVTLRRHDDAPEFIAGLTGTDRLIADYLTEEVLEAQPSERRDTLLRMSVLDEMRDELVTAVTGDDTSQLLLEQLERESLFLVPLDNRREWFRFHHLFRDLLRFRLRAEQPGAERELLETAAQWHLDRDEIAAAAGYLERAEDWDLIVKLILSRGEDVFIRGEMATVIHWIEKVPTAVRSRTPDLEILHGILLAMEGQAVRAEEILTRLLKDPQLTLGQRMVVLSDLAARAQFLPDVAHSIDCGERALELVLEHPEAPLPDLLHLTDHEFLRTTTEVSLGRAYFFAGDFDPARRHLVAALETVGVTFPPYRVHALGSLALLDALSGRLVEAERESAEALALAREAQLLGHPAPADAYLARAWVFLERGEPQRAALAVREGVLRAASNRRNQLLWVGYLAEMLMVAAGGASDPELSAPPADAPPPLVRDRLSALESRTLRTAGHAERALLALPFDMAGAAPAVGIERAAVALTLDRLETARTVIDGLHAADALEEPHDAVAGSLLRAWLAEASGGDDALEHLRSALEVAERHGLVETFIEAGPVVIRMLGSHGIEPSPFRSLVLQRATESVARLDLSELPEALTSRELEILSYLPSRYTNVELAERCFVSVNTIKTHMAHIYRKLDAPNRNAAIVRARQVGLL